MSAPTLGTLSVDADLIVSIPVDDMGGSSYVRVDYAVPPDGAQPAQTSLLWRTIETIETESTVTTPPQTYGTTVWVRASGRTSGGELMSTYAVDSIAIDDVPRLISVTFELVDGIVPVVTWAEAATCDGVRILWEVHEAGDDPGSLANSADIEANVGTYTIPEALQLGQAITIEVQAWESWDSAHETVDGEQGLSVSTVLTPPVLPCVRTAFRTVTSYEYTLTGADACAYILYDYASAASLIFPEDATATIAIGSTGRFEQVGAGQVVAVPETSDVTLNSLGNQLGTSGQHAVVWWTKTAANTWTLYGDIAS